MYTIYGVEKQGEIIYIGSTKNLQQRLRAHRRTYGDDVQMISLAQTITKGEAHRMEQLEIEKNQAAGGQLYNIRMARKRTKPERANWLNRIMDKFPDDFI